MKDTNKKNPNLEAKELIEPMVYFDENDKPLIEPMIYYDRKLDFNYPLPPTTPLGVDYYQNYNSQIINSPNTNNEIFSQSSFPTTERKRTIQKSSIEENNVNAYTVLQDFLSKVKVIVIKDLFYIYNGKGYAEIDFNSLGRKVVAVCRPLLINKSNSFIDGVVKFILKEPKIYIEEEDIPKTLIAFQNGVLDITTRNFMSHSSSLLTLYEVRGEYCPQKQHSTFNFDKYLYSITGGDTILCERILQMIGYCLTPDTKAKCFFLFQGVANSGKSVLCNLMQKLFSDNAVFQLDISAFSDKFAMSNLVGKALCSIPDMPSLPVDDNKVSKIKQLTGNDPTTSDVKFSKRVKFLCSAKLILTTNHPLLTKTNDDAFQYRICTIPFKFAVDKSHQDFDLEDKLFAERNGIVNKAMEAYFRLKNNEYRFAGDYSVNEITETEVSAELNLETNIYIFMKKYYTPCEDSIVFTDDAYSLFINQYNFVQKGVFSEYFSKFSQDIGGIKTRKRRTATSNPLSCIKGISLKSEVGNEIL